VPGNLAAEPPAAEGWLSEAWLGAVGALGGQPGLATDGATDLQRRYSEPHRRYHTLQHIRCVLRDVALLSAELNLGGRDTALALAAACAHDVIYDARPGDDERASASWAQRHLAATQIPRAAADRVVALVLATAGHAAGPGDHPAEVLLDADLAILGSAAPDYDRYVRAVREEYRQVPGDLWRAGRAQVLMGLRGRGQVYVTGPARRRWEAAARANLDRELAALQDG
jgi:predicted metal-dependent HD superfamily phosphohydrolase